MTRLAIGLAVGSIASIGWPLAVIVLAVVVLVAFCGVEFVDETPGGRRRRFRIRRLQDPR
jgi:fatty acid desaturase